MHTSLNATFLASETSVQNILSTEEIFLLSKPRANASAICTIDAASIRQYA